MTTNKTSLDRPPVIGFFLGSGCSFPSNQPSIQELTDEVLHGEFYLIESREPFGMALAGLENNYPRWGSKLACRQWIKESETDLDGHRRPALGIQRFLQFLAGFPDWVIPPNYEDLSGVLRLGAAAAYQKLNDPMVNSFYRQYELFDRVAAIEFPPQHRFHSSAPNTQLSIVEDFIGWVIASSIRTAPNLLGYESLSYVLERLRSEGMEVHIATTNYDCNLERLLGSLKIRFHDGLVGERVQDNNGASWRIGTRFEFFREDTMALVKLHGSLNWHTCYDTHGSGAAVYAMCRRSLRPEIAWQRYIHDPDGFVFTAKQSPAMLRGSLSKAHEYSEVAYAQLLMGFESLLQRADLIVVAGFGWADEGIAARLIRFATVGGGRLLALDGHRPRPAITGSSYFSDSMLDRPGQRRSIALHKAHMSETPPEELMELVREAM